jgi:alpha-D-xyloside xylohydrolase
MGRLAAVAALALALAGCGSSTPAPPGLALRVGHDPFLLTVVRNGRTVVAEDAHARLRYQLASGAEHALTKVTAVHGNAYEVATDEQGRTATVTVTRIAPGFHVAVRFHPAGGIAFVFDAFAAGPDDHFLGGGSRSGGIDLRGQVVPVKVSYACGAIAVPYFSSTAGWGLRLDSQHVAGLAFPGSPGGTGCRFGAGAQCSFPALVDTAEVCVRDSRLDEDLYVGGLAATLAAFQAAAGQPRVPPPSELALIKWRDEVSGPGQIIEDVTRFQGARVPIGWVLLDNPWEPCIGDLTFDPTRIPDPAGLIRRVHALGVKFMLWISPKVYCGGGYPPSALVGLPADKPVLDLRRPSVFAAFKARLRRLYALGVDGIKADRGDDADLDALSPTAQNDYPLLFAHAALDGMPPTFAAIFRAGTVGSAAVVPGFWGGDQTGDFPGLQQAIELGASAAMSGFPTWGSDVGGYDSTGLTPEVFARWAQLGAVSPIMEVGGIGANATPWTLGAGAMTALRAAAVLHYELFPYLYGLLRRHQPVLRPLGYAYPGDPQAWKASLELLVGPDLFAAPVIGGGTTPSVYLPRGAWVDLYTGEPETGGRVFIRPTPDTEFPFYVRAGAVLPFNLRTTDPATWWGVDELTHPGRAGFLATNLATLSLRGQPRDVQLFVPAPARPRRVLLGGRAVAWTWSPGPLPGVVVRVHGPTVRGKIVLSRT